MFASDGLAVATPIRFPSTANLAISSYNRDGNPDLSEIRGSNGANFSISKRQNLLAGFFTRIAVNELVLDYALPNIAATYNNNVFSVLVEGEDQLDITIPAGNYTVATLMVYILAELNASGGYGSLTWTFDGADGQKSLTATGAFSVPYTVLAGDLSITPTTATVDSVDDKVPVFFPEILPISYLDFTCSNLTYQQGLKDADTSNTTRDVLYRWVLAWDDMNPLDADGYPIYQGYMPFKSRRYLNFPKQIKWDSQQPIGQLQFQVYNSSGELAKTTQKGVFEWYMNLLVSEQ
jgi:hypothetical protein